MSLHVSPFLALWVEARDSEHGLWLSTHNVAHCKAELYGARTRAMDDTLRAGKVLTSPLGDKGHLWIVFPHHVPPNEDSPEA